MKPLGLQFRIASNSVDEKFWLLVSVCGRVIGFEIPALLQGVARRFS